MELKELSLALLAGELRTIDWDAAKSIVFNSFNYLNFFNSRFYRGMFPCFLAGLVSFLFSS